MTLSLAETNAEILDALPVQVWKASPDGALTFVNRFVSDYFGLTAERIVGEGWQDRVHPADLPEVVRRWSHALQSGTPYSAEFRLLRGADHQFRWHEVRAKPLRGSSGITTWVGTNIDVDAVKRAAEVHAAALSQVRLEREKVRRVFNEVPVALSVLTGPDHRIEQMNERARQMLGGRNLEGLTVRKALPELAGQGHFERLDAVYASGETWESREVAVRFDRFGTGEMEDGWFDITYHPLEDESDQVYGLISVSVEVSGHVRARREVQRLVAERETVLSQLSDGIIIADGDGRITFLNDTAKSLHGVIHLNVPPNDYSDAYQLLTMDERPHPFHELPLARAVLQGEDVPTTQWKVRRPDGAVVVLEGEARPIQNAHGQSIGAVLMHRPARNADA